MPVWARALIELLTRLGRWALARREAVEEAKEEARNTREDAARRVGVAEDDALDDMLRKPSARRGR